MGSPHCRRRHLGRCGLLLAALASAVALRRRWGRLFVGCDLFASARPPALRPQPRAHRTAASCSDGESTQDAAWKEAYELERERNELLRDQLQSQGLKTLLLNPEAPEPNVEPDACAVDWEQNYESLAACNRALEEELRGKPVPAPSASPSPAAVGPALLKVPIAEQGVLETIELSRFFGGAGAFYVVQARLPLGLELQKRDGGGLMGAFVVENVLPGGAADASGEVTVGDVLQAVTVVMDNQDLGMKTEDFVSSVVGGLGRYRQVLSDASFIDTADDLVEAIKSNTMLSSEVQITLVFERDTAALSAPKEPLEPVS
mmetsp:Transcript_63424/g.127147  ORF Transcript_63424/g.127147 Transcript_63424/m.127147 type:complete len:317 (+) Transcript_63424:58-1008(+)